MAFNTSTVARWTTLSSSTVTPSGRSRPSDLCDERSPRRFRSVRSALQPLREIVEILLQSYPHSAATSRRRYARCGIPLEAEVGLPECVGAVNVVQERGEPQRRIPRCRLTYSHERAGACEPGLESGACACSCKFPLATRLPSLPSAAGRPALFGDFSGTTRVSDFPQPCIFGVRPWTSRCGPRRHATRAVVGSPGSRTRCVRTCVGSLTAQGSDVPRDIGTSDVAFPNLLQGRHPEESYFRGSIPSLPAPLSTLRGRGCPPDSRMTRGRCGSLLLQRSRLSL